jgi:predicted ABC-class ATPase
MLAFEPQDVTGPARKIAEETRSMRLEEKRGPFRAPMARVPRLRPNLNAKSLKVGLRGAKAVRVGEETIDLQAVEQLVESGQVRALGPLMRRAARQMDGGLTLASLVGELDAWLDREGIDALDRPVAYDLSRPRRFELAAALNRWRGLEFFPASPREEDV